MTLTKNQNWNECKIFHDLSIFLPISTFGSARQRLRLFTVVKARFKLSELCCLSNTSSGRFRPFSDLLTGFLGGKQIVSCLLFAIYVPLDSIKTPRNPITLSPFWGGAHANKRLQAHWHTTCAVKTKLRPTDTVCTACNQASTSESSWWRSPEK